MDWNFDQPVDLAIDGGLVHATEEKPFYARVWQQILVPTTSGDRIRMIDWASINNWNGTRSCTWMPIRQGGDALRGSTPRSRSATTSAIAK